MLAISTNIMPVSHGSYMVLTDSGGGRRGSLFKAELTRELLGVLGFLLFNNYLVRSWTKIAFPVLFSVGCHPINTSKHRQGIISPKILFSKDYCRKSWKACCRREKSKAPHQLSVKSQTAHVKCKGNPITRVARWES